MDWNGRFKGHDSVGRAATGLERDDDAPTATRIANAAMQVHVERLNLECSPQKTERDCGRYVLQYRAVLMCSAMGEMVNQTATGGRIAYDPCEGVTNMYPWNGPDPFPSNEMSLRSDARRAYYCLQDKVDDVGGSFQGTWFYRPQPYQDHIREVYDNYQIVKNWRSGQCEPTQSEVRREWGVHSPFARRPAVESDHTSNIAFDAEFNVPADEDIDVLAAKYGLGRTVPDDPVHFVYVG